MTTQNLQTLMNATTMKAKIEAKAKEEKKEKTFHQKELDRKAADPENTAYKEAVLLGKAHAAAFMQSVYNVHDKDHEKNFKTFDTVYKSDPRLAEKDLIAQACEKLGAAEYEMYDPNYVEKLKKKYQPQGENATEASLRFYQNFCEALDKKHEMVGFRNDKKWVEAFTMKYHLMPNQNNSDLVAFQLKD